MQLQPVDTRLSPRSIPERLVRKYETNGPRYTSYPTAPQFAAEFDRPAIEALWRETNATGNGLSFYVHLPFCSRRCLYCGCFTEVGHAAGTVAAYVEAVLHETDRLAALIDARRPVRQVALGGGTPTLLAPDAMRAFVTGLRERLAFADDREQAIEIDPRSVDEDYVAMLLDLGFNRLSFGVQDFDPAVQKIIGRVQDEERLRGLVSALRRRGFGAFNFDLIYGLPGQTARSFAATIEKTIELAPSRVVLFGYAHVPWVSPHQKALEAHGLPDARERIELHTVGYEMLLGAGYVPVGMDHFALPGDELATALANRSLTRNFMGYTTRRGLDLVAVGASSISAVGWTFTQNVKDVKVYLARAADSAWTKAFILSHEDRLRREVILDLFCNHFLDIRGVENSWGISFAEHFKAEIEKLAAMEADGLVRVDEAAIVVTDPGRFFIRNICMVFDQYLGDGSKRYSRTV